MKNSPGNEVNKEEVVDEGSFRNAMYASILFVGGGIVIFWLILFIFFSVRL
ncbi:MULTISPECIES: hypothetical protein [Sporosarcina]|uniref:hypothetical protein n=1 Tax=Sporosarcina TaxID=1569 RepID=UPI0012EBE02D|nr:MULTISPECIES: hypothetical protein [Sporosarcina]